MTHFAKYISFLRKNIVGDESKLFTKCATPTVFRVDECILFLAVDIRIYVNSCSCVVDMSYPHIDVSHDSDKH